jgi:ketosteroid isomerase-like protein
MNAADTFLDFVNAVNAHDVRRLCDLMDTDHVFVDSLGQEHRGRAIMNEGWTAYFAMIPDYKISIAQFLVDSNTVLAVGEACGTYTRDGRLSLEDRWRVPAAWRAIIKGQQVARWQVYTDNEPIRALIRKVNEPKSS